MDQSQRPQVVECKENDWNGEAPKTVGELGLERIVGRKIIKWEPHMGSYGMGGPGFSGLLLQSNGQYQSEWLVLRIWGATHWLSLDDKSIDESNLYSDIPLQRFFAVLSSSGGKVLSKVISSIWRVYVTAYWKLGRPLWDKVWKQLVGSKILNVQMRSQDTLIKLQKGSGIHTLSFKGPLMNDVIHEEAWIVSKSGHLYC